MKKISFFLVFATILVACSKELETIHNTSSNSSSPVFTAIREQIVDDSKAVISGNECRWEKDDQIYVTDGENWAKYKAESVDDEGVATFLIMDGEPGLNPEASGYKAYYPVSMVLANHSLYLPQQTLNENGELSEEAQEAGMTTDNYKLSLYKNNPMYAESSGTSLQFRNLCGLVKLHMVIDGEYEIGIPNSDYAISQIIMEDNNAELFGPFVIEDGKFKSTAQSSDIVNYRRVASKNSNAKWASCVHDFYLVLPPAIYDATSFLMITNLKGIQSWMLKNGSTMTIESGKMYTLTLRINDVLVNTNKPTDSNPDRDLSKGGTLMANCYVPPLNGANKVYRFKATRGCEWKMMRNIKSAGLLWRAQMSTSQAKADNLGDIVIKDVSWHSGYIQFETTGNQGNAVIAAYDGPDCTGNIVWSWHIWGVNSNNLITDIECPNGIIMDRNIGALYADLDIPTLGGYDVQSSSMFSAGFNFQWGRKDPFMGRVNNGSSKGYWKACSPERNVDFKSNVAAVSIETTIQNPNVFYGTTDGVWCSETEKPTWDGEQKSIYDPCPAGYRVWSKGALGDLLSKDKFSTNVHLISVSDTGVRNYQNLGFSCQTSSGDYLFFSVNGQYNNKNGTWGSYITQYRSWFREVDSSGQTGFYNITQDPTSIESQNPTCSIKAITATHTQPQCSGYGMGVRCQKI